MSILSKKKFILTIGDEGSILTLMNGKKIENRVFAQSSSLADRRDIHNFLLEFPSVPIYILLDNVEQTYNRQTFPAVSSFVVGKLVKKRLDKDFSKTDIKNARLLGRQTQGRRDWKYMFVSVPLSESMDEWFNYVQALDNKVVGIFMLPLEVENLINSLGSKKKKNKKNNVELDKEEPADEKNDVSDEGENIENADWQFLVTYNKVGGFRQVVTKNGKLIFTRLLHKGKETLPGIIAGNIEQEVLNTIDYLRRLSFSDNEKIQVTAIVAEDVKESLASTQIRGQNISLFTAFEASKYLGLSGDISEDDQFADTLIAANFANCRPLLKLSTPDMSQVNSIILAETFSIATATIISFLFIILSSFSVFDILDLNSSIKRVENEKAAIERKWENVQKSGDYDIDEAHKITDVVGLDEVLGRTKYPMDLIEKISVSSNNFSTTKSLNWTYIPDKKFKELGIERAVFNLEFFNKGNSLESLFVNYDKFVSNLKDNLTEYDSNISDLPDKVTFDTRDEPIDVQVRVFSRKK